MPSALLTVYAKPSSTISIWGLLRALKHNNFSSLLAFFVEMKSAAPRELNRMVGLAGVKRNRQKLLNHRTISFNPLGKIVSNLIVSHVRSAGDFKKPPVLGAVEMTELID